MNAPKPAHGELSRTQRFRQAYRAELPEDYQGWQQQRRTTAAMLVTAALLLAGIRDWSWPLAGVFAGVWAACCLGEYLSHRFPMHHPLKGLEFMFRRHVRVHHRYFTDAEMAGEDAKDVHATVLAPVQLVVVLLLGALPLSLGCGLLFGADAARVCGISILVYLSVFEWVHLACHLPKDHPAMAIPGLARAREHHRLHHAPKHMSTHNFQISNPWIDLPLGSALSDQDS